jgi:SAM-dependent methyltransferase
MPTLEDVKREFSRNEAWKDFGDEWSVAWGNARVQWYGSIMPRIQRFVPTDTIVEIAPGMGRWTQFLAGLSNRLEIVDVAPNCIEYCKKRFSHIHHIRYHVNDGHSLSMIEAGGANFVFSFDSLVHVQWNVLKSYLREVQRILSPDGVAFLHHSNLGAILPGDTIQTHWRGEDVTADLVKQECERIGTGCAQELINWGNDSGHLLDCFSLIGKTVPNCRYTNCEFMAEASALRKVASLYAPPNAHECDMANRLSKTSPSVLVIGVYLLDKSSHICRIRSQIDKSSRWEVKQRWIGLGTGAVPGKLADVTVRKVNPPAMKFTLLNQLLSETNIDPFEFVVVCDDDIALPESFLDRYLELVMRYDFALAQPARTHDSFIDHPFVEQLDGLLARRTRFVEIGPLFSVHKRAFPLIFPFDEASPMGWGYDFFWPTVVAKANLKMGIIDSVPVTHSLRKPVSYYQHETASREKDGFLKYRPHLSPDEAFFIVDSYAV